MNSFIEPINKHRLPKHILFLLDSDILSGTKAKNKAGVSRDIGNYLCWITKSVETIIEVKKEDIYQKRPGALTQGEPNVIWIKMLKRPNSDIKNNEDMCTLHHKYNDILEETLVARKNHFIMNVQAAITSTYFDRSSHFTNQGKIKFWEEVNQQLQLFDQGKLELKP